jgi:hypothetical protein
VKPEPCFIQQAPQREHRGFFVDTTLVGWLSISELVTLVTSHSPERPGAASQHLRRHYSTGMQALWLILDHRSGTKRLSRKPVFNPLDPPLLGEEKRDLGTPQTPAAFCCTSLSIPSLSKRDSREFLELGDTSHPEASLRPNPRQGGFAPLHTLAKCQCHSRVGGNPEKGAHKTRCTNCLSTLWPPTLFQPVFARSRRRRGNLGGWRLLRLLLATLGEWLAMTNDWGTSPSPGRDLGSAPCG